jgi:hypothetical protein
MPTVGVHIPLYSGQTGFTLYLYDGDALINSGGDALTETPLNVGYFTASVSESLVGTLLAVVENSGGAPVYQEWLYSGQSIAGPLQVGVPAVSQVSKRVSGTNLTAYVGEQVTFTIYPLDANGDAINPSGFTLEVVIENQDWTDRELIEDGAISKTSTSFSFTVAAATNSAEGILKWSARKSNTKEVVAHGDYRIAYAAIQDS